MLNLSQMAGCIGQQAVRGERLMRGLLEQDAAALRAGRPRRPGARVRQNSLQVRALTPTEFFFHSMGGREGAGRHRGQDVPVRLHAAPADQRARGPQGQAGRDRAQHRRHDHPVQVRGGRHRPVQGDILEAGRHRRHPRRGPGRRGGAPRAGSRTRSVAGYATVEKDLMETEEGEEEELEEPEFEAGGEE